MNTTFTAEEREELRRILSMGTSSVDGCGLFYREAPRLLNALEQAEAQLAAALQVNAARQAEVTADVLNAMMAGITGQKESVRVEVEGFQCPYCNEISKTIEAATAHDAICPKHPAVIRAEALERDLNRVKAAGIEAMRRAEQAEARAEKAEKELAGADAEISELRDELEDSRGTEKDAPNVLCAIARLVGVYEHCQELGDDMGTMSLDAVQGLLAEKQKAEAESVRLTKMVDFMAQQMADVYSTDEDGRYTLTCPVRTLRAADHDCDKISCPQCWKEAASRAVAAGEG